VQSQRDGVATDGSVMRCGTRRSNRVFGTGKVCKCCYDAVFHTLQTDSLDNCSTRTTSILLERLLSPIVPFSNSYCDPAGTSTQGSGTKSFSFFFAY
jgi:hypothetical protein